MDGRLGAVRPDSAENAVHEIAANACLGPLQGECRRASGSAPIPLFASTPAFRRSRPSRALVFDTARQWRVWRRSIPSGWRIPRHGLFSHHLPGVDESGTGFNGTRRCRSRGPSGKAAYCSARFRIHPSAAPMEGQAIATLLGSPFPFPSSRFLKKLRKARPVLDEGATSPFVRPRRDNATTPT